MRAKMAVQRLPRLRAPHERDGRSHAWILFLVLLVVPVLLGVGVSWFSAAPAQAGGGDGRQWSIRQVTNLRTDSQEVSIAVEGDMGVLAWHSDYAGDDGEILYQRLENPGRIDAITDNDYRDGAAQVTLWGDGYILWLARHEHADADIMSYNLTTGITRRVTDNAVEDSSLRVVEGWAVWQQQTAPGADREIYGHRPGFQSVSRITDNDRDDTSPDTDGSLVVWQGWDGNDWEIYQWESGFVTALTNNVGDDMLPRIYNGSVVWQGWDGNDWEIYFYKDGRWSQVTSNATDDMYPQVYVDGTTDYVAWQGGPAVNQVFFGTRERFVPLTAAFAGGPAVREPLGGGPAFESRQLSPAGGFNSLCELGPLGVVWVRDEPGRHSDVYHSTLGGTVSAITQNDVIDALPVADGDYVAFQSRRNGEFEIFLATPDEAPPMAGVDRPADGDLVSGSHIVIDGWARDDTFVDLVEVSTDGGRSYRPAAIVNGAQTGNLRWNLQWELGDIEGERDIRVRVLDGAGKWADAVPYPTVVVDNVPPVLRPVLVNDGDAVTNSRDVMVTAGAEDISRPLEVSLSVNAGVNWSPWQEAATPEGTYRVQLPLEERMHTVWVRFRDAAGNETAFVSDGIRLEQGIFGDVGIGHPYGRAIYTLCADGIINGYASGGGWEFRPDQRVLRAQFAKMVCGTMGLPVNEEMTCPFVDLGPDDPASLYPHEFAAAAFANGITRGTSETAFSPWADITRAQVVTMMVRAAQNLMPGVLVIPPAGYRGTLGDFDSTHSPYMRLAEYNGLLEGLAGFGADWEPWSAATRGETAHLLGGLLDLGGV